MQPSQKKKKKKKEKKKLKLRDRQDYVKIVSTEFIAVSCTTWHLKCLWDLGIVSNYFLTLITLYL